MKELTKANVTVGELFKLAGFPIPFGDLELHYTEEISGFSDEYGHSGDRYWMAGCDALFHDGEWLFLYDENTFMADDTSLNLQNLPAVDAYEVLPNVIKAAYDKLPEGK